MSEPDLTRRALYPHLVDHPIRYGDTDRQGHVNNVVYQAYFEFGRTMLLVTELAPLAAAECEPVLVRTTVDFRKELYWPGSVTIGTGVLSIGTTSARFAQAVFSGDVCAASGEAVIVLIDSATRRPTPWNAEQRAALERLSMKTPA